MTNLNYKLILQDSLKIYKKNFLAIILSLIFISFSPIISALITGLTDKNKIVYYLLTVPILLLVILFSFYFNKFGLDAIFNKVGLKSFKFHYNTFANFIINQFLVCITVFISALPTVLASIVFLVALNDRIKPYNKLNFGFDDFRLALSGVYTYFYVVLVVALLNLPLIIYALLRFAFSGYYVINKEFTAIEAIKENFNDTADLDLVHGFGMIFVFLVIELVLGIIGILTMGVFLNGQYDKDKFLLLLVLIPIVLIPLYAIQMALAYKKISQKQLIATI
jgi:hypothetical protein